MDRDPCSVVGDVRFRSVTGVTVVGVRGHLVAVEAHVGRGLPSLTLTGLYLDDPLEGFGLSVEDSAVRHSLMDIEFLG
jgi:hypothetical protein